MKFYNLIQSIAVVSALKINISESPQEVGVPETPGPRFSLGNAYTTPPFKAPLGNKSAHAPWPAPPTSPLVYSGRYGIGDKVQKFKFDMTPGKDAKYQEVQVGKAAKLSQKVKK